MQSAQRQPLLLAALLLCVVAVMIWSAIAPADRLTWWMEVLPVLIALPILFATYSRFPFTTLVYCLIFLHMILLIVGGHYTYAHVPLGFWLQELFDFSRNHYDRIGHVMQGFVPAMVAREILIRRAVVKSAGWRFVFITSFCLAFSAFYEFIEWWSALIYGSSVQEFLGTQGDVWDTQWDMFLAFVGAVLAQVLLGKWHDRQLQRIKPQTSNTK